MKHTKGEWAYKHSESKDAFNVIGTALGGKYKIARCPYHVIKYAPELNKRDKQEAEANAKLIAAAPDMFNALQIAYDYLSQNCFEDYDHWKEVQLAIKKATE
jgi:hypothetical protein